MIDAPQGTIIKENNHVNKQKVLYDKINKSTQPQITDLHEN